MIDFDQHVHQIHRRKVRNKVRGFAIGLAMGLVLWALLILIGTDLQLLAGLVARG